VKNTVFVLVLLATSLYCELGEITAPISTTLDSHEVNSSSSVNSVPATPLISSLFEYREPLNDSGFNAFVEYLFFWVNEEGCDNFVLAPNGYTYPQAAIDNPTSFSSVDIGEYKGASFEGSSGVRFGFGYTFEREYWNLLGQYTFYSTDGAVTIRKPSNSFIFATLPNLNGNLNIAESSTKFNYQITDLLLSKRFTLGNQILLNLHLGLAGAWIDQKWLVNYFDGIDTFVKNQWHYHAGGFTLGLDNDWHLGHGFGIFNALSCGIFCGRYSWDIKYTISPPTSGYLNPIGNATLSNFLATPALRFDFGVDWGKVFDSWAFKLLLAFEVNTWFNLEQMFKLTTFAADLTDDRKSSFSACNVNVFGLTGRFDVSY